MKRNEIVISATPWRTSTPCIYVGLTSTACTRPLFALDLLHGYRVTGPNVKQSGVEVVSISASLPLEVRQWVDRKAAQAYKSRGGWVRDLLVQMMRRETEKP